MGRRGEPNLHQNQEAGPAGTNYQAGRDVVVTGITYDDARQIAQDAVRANLYLFRAEAEQVVARRVVEISDMFVARMHRESAEALESVKDPDVQYSLITVGREYARTGDPDLGQVLVDLLADRCSSPGRTLMAVVLNDAIVTAARLTQGELNILSLAWTVLNTKSTQIVSLQALADYVDREICPFLESVPAGDAAYLHLQYLGCAAVNHVQSVNLVESWLKVYSGVFSKGFEIDEIPDGLRSLVGDRRVFIPCLRDSGKLQINATDADGIKQLAGRIERPDDADSLVSLQESHLLSPEEARAALIDMTPCMKRLLELLEATHLQRLTLTSVGMAIAHANTRRVTGMNSPLSIWVSEEGRPAS